MHKKYPVVLTEAERETLDQMIRARTESARKLSHARILLKSDEGPAGPGWVDEAVADAVEVSQPTVARIRRQYVEEGLEAALNRRPPHRVDQRKLAGEAEAQLIALTCSEPPDGHGRWSLRLLADKLVELDVVDSLSHQTVQRVLKKRPHAVAEEAVVHSSGQQWRVRLADGGRTGGVHPSVHFQASPSLPG